ncbi:MAG: neutral/alkaline non-lysosomal ceramidase N-terminal domain-containing protein [Bryobacterales bacterium]|nr:neutral/alkaline non-lysosomal ceramidase N-terminal domain-containing protein [Bryobacterales bacterium]
MRAGFAKVLVTPQVGSQLTGYAARQGAAEGVHDELYARTVVLEGGTGALALVSVDVLALGAEFVSDVRRRIHARTGIEPERVLVAATHTHSGPVTIRTFFNENESPDAIYMERLAAAIEQCAAIAWQERFSARLAVGACTVEGAGFNRCGPARVVDREAAIVRVDDAAGHIRGVVMQYGCHPTVLGFENLQITADFPGAAIAAIEASLGPGCQAVFFNGAQGNVSVNHASELNAIGVPTPDRTFERAAGIGNRLANAVLGALPHLVPEEITPIRVMMWPLELEGRRYGVAPAEELEQARRRVAASTGGEDLLRRAKADELYAGIHCANARMIAGLGGRIPFPLQAVRIGDAIFLGAPGEVFTETGLALKHQVDPRLFVIGLANGYYGYVPTDQAFTEEGYEASVACCAPGSAQRVIEAVRQIVLRMRQTTPPQADE